MADNCAVGVYTTLNDAEKAMRSLSDNGFPVDKVSIIATHQKDEGRRHEFAEAADVAHWSETAGTLVGGILGALARTAFIWVPGFGPLIVAGSLAAVLIGAVEGAIAGAAVSGVVGWLVGLGISKEHIRKYQEAVKAGKFLVIAHGPADVARRAHDILAVSRPEQLDLHTPAKE